MPNVAIDRIRKTKNCIGFLATVINSHDVDYLEMAYLQGLNIKITQHPDANKYAIIVDKATHAKIQDKHRKVFDEIIVVDEWDYSKEWQVYNLTPWKHTFKIDVDCIFTRDLVAFREIYRFKPVNLARIIYSYKNEIIHSIWHRAFVNGNSLPNVYTAFYYFCHGHKNTEEFFEILGEVSQNIREFATQFTPKLNLEKIGDDEIFSIAAEIVGDQNVSQKEYDLGIVHMKNQLNDLPGTAPWSKQLYFELSFYGGIIIDDKKINANDEMITRSELYLIIGHHKMVNAVFHYCDKTLIKNTDILEKHEQRFSEIFGRISGSQSAHNSQEDKLVSNI